MKILADGAFMQNSYVLEIDSKLVVIDPGYNYKLIKEELGDRVPDYILITHYHFDHVACLDKLAEDYNMKAHIHEEDLSFVIKDTGATLLGFAPVTVKRENVTTFKDSIEGLPSLEILHMPGHTKGSTIYKLDNKLFVGDIIFADGFGRIDLPGANPEHMKETLMKLKNMDKSLIIYSGHGPIAPLKDTLLYR